MYNPVPVADPKQPTPSAPPWFPEGLVSVFFAWQSPLSAFDFAALSEEVGSWPRAAKDDESLRLIVQGDSAYHAHFDARLSKPTGSPPRVQSQIEFYVERASGRTRSIRALFDVLERRLGDTPQEGVWGAWFEFGSGNWKPTFQLPYRPDPSWLAGAPAIVGVDLEFASDDPVRRVYVTTYPDSNALVVRLLRRDSLVVSRQLGRALAKKAGELVVRFACRSAP